MSAATLIASLPSLTDAQSISDPISALVLLIHATHTSLGFRLDPTTTTKVTLQERELAYKHDQSSLSFVVRIGQLGQRLTLDAIALEDDKPYHLSFPLSSTLAPSSSFPYPLNPPSTSKPLVHAFLSEFNVNSIVEDYKREIVDKLVPSLGGKSTTSSSSSSTTVERTSENDRRDRSQVNPPGLPAHHPAPPPSSSTPFGSRIPNLGSSDLDPLAASPLNVFRPPPLFGGGRGGSGVGGGGGMIFDPTQIQPPSVGGGVGEHLNPSPRGFQPPGARWDPITPFDPPSGGGSLVPRGGGGPGEPDNDEFLPPGMENGERDFGIRFPGQGRGRGGGGSGGMGGFGGGLGGGGGRGAFGGGGFGGFS